MIHRASRHALRLRAMTKEAGSERDPRGAERSNQTRIARRRAEEERADTLSSASDDEVGGFRARSARSGAEQSNTVRINSRPTRAFCASGCRTR